MCKANTFTCVVCGAEFIRYREHALHCSNACRYKEMHEKVTANCKRCRKEFTRTMYGTGVDTVTYCSRECYYGHLEDIRKPKEVKACIMCGVLLSGKTRMRCGECLKIYNAYRQKKRSRIESFRDYIDNMSPRECKVCGVWFAPKYYKAWRKSNICSDKCKRKTEQKGTHRRRARKAGVAFATVNRIKVFERDAWRCHICGKKTNRKHIGKMFDDAPELDHILPITKGGEHTYRNVACSHRKCNGDKGGTGGGQQRLFATECV